MQHTTYREEDFLDLGLEIEEHMSLTACLKKLRSTEILRAQNKFHCERCNSLQEAKKETRLRQVPRVLVLHFKRFKVLEAGPQRLQFSKLCYRIPFPTEMAIEDEADATSYFQLFAVVIHVGRGPNSGHYVTAVRCRNTWLLFDDESIRPVDADQMASLCFGQYHRDSPSSATAYILFFQRVERK
jgi:ubiquitin C-terminal hydrolase